MSPALLFILSIIGLLALYWALIGQWRWNRMLRENSPPEKDNALEEKKVKDEAGKR
ncbi:hypothetical protein KY358_06970 [Candidatus Woesearchaeota archaeon]|nr:hypothetical protein [Candidatus Woesearchaeota archaeon]